MKTGQANKGKWLEAAIKLTGGIYAKRQIGLFEKIDTPLYQMKTGDWRRKRSTVDYWGHIHGHAVAFDCKVTAANLLTAPSPKKKAQIPQHQVDFLARFAWSGAVAFLLVHFSTAGVTYIVPIWYYLATLNGRKSIPLKEIEKGCILVEHGNNGVPIDLEPGILAMIKYLTAEANTL